MKFAYYPGCSARCTCAELNEATHLVAARLGLDLMQLESATCTGARELRAIDPAGFYALNVRILALAEREGLPLMTICNTCTLNLLDAHAAFVSDRSSPTTVNARLAEEGLHYSGRTKISHFLWVLHEDIGEAAAARSWWSTADRSYRRGLLWLPYHPAARPLRVCRFAQQRRAGAACRNPRLPADRLFSGRTECCGFHTAAHDERIAIKLTGQHIRSAKASGAKTMVTPCPLCHTVLDGFQREIEKTWARSSTCRSCTCRNSSAWRWDCRLTNCISTVTWCRLSLFNSMRNGTRGGLAASRVCTKFA